MQGANTDARCEHQQLTEMAADDYIQIMCCVLFLLCCFCCEECCFCFFFSLVVIVSNKTRLTEQQSRRVASHLWRMKRHLKLKDLLFTTGYTTNVRTQLLGANTKSSEHRSNTSESESEYVFISCHVGPLHPLVFAP